MVFNLRSIILSAALLCCLSVAKETGKSRGKELGYTVTDLGTIGGGKSYAVAVNERGQVLGRVPIDDAHQDDFVQHTFLWRDGRLDDLGTEFIGTALNKSGAICGFTSPKGSDLSNPFGISFHPVLWDQGRLQDLLPAAYTSGRAVGINEKGQVTGTLTHIDRSTVPPVPKVQPFLMEGGKLHFLRVPPGYVQGLPNAVNEAGQVAGYLQVYDPRVGGMPEKRAALWNKEQVELLNTLPGSDQSEAVDINNRGVVLCRAFFGLNNVTAVRSQQTNSSAVTQRGFLWEAGLLNSRVIDLGTTAAASQSSIDSAKGYIPKALNNLGHVVGQATASDGGRVAFLWQNGALYNLNDFLPAESGWQLEEAVSINDAGQIVGSGKHNGYVRAFLLTPQ